MPVYDFSCTKCAKKFEHLVRRYDSPAPACEDCQSPTERAEVSVPRRFGEYANACSLRIHINWPER